MTARPFKTVCISVYEDDLAALDAFVEGCPGLNRSMLVRLALVTVGVIKEPEIVFPRKTNSEPQDFSKLVQATFLLGDPRSGTKGRRVRAKPKATEVVP